MKKFLVTLLLVGCSTVQTYTPPPDVQRPYAKRFCTSACGVILQAPDHESCKNFQDAAEEAVKRISKYAPYVCKELQDWVVKVHPVQSWAYSVSGVTLPIEGLTVCATHRMEIAKRMQDPWCVTALLHEFIHAMNCEMPFSAPGHIGWEYWKYPLDAAWTRCE